jgi:hypothetical protein
MVSQSADAAHLPGGLIERAALRRFPPARGLSSAKGYEERGEARQQSSMPDPRGGP